MAYAYDDDGNVTAMVGGGAAQYFSFDSANQLVCAGETLGGCERNGIRYDVHGQRIMDLKGPATYDVYVGDDFVYRRLPTAVFAEVEIRAFGERVALKTFTPTLRTAGGIPFALPPEVLGGLAALGLLSLLVWGAREGAWVLVVQRPAHASLCLVVSVALVTLPAATGCEPPEGPSVYWELSDPLGTGLLLLDETGARIRHTQLTPFGRPYTTVGSMLGLRSYYAGHREHAETGLYYMQARWYDASSGRFIRGDVVES